MAFSEREQAASAEARRVLRYYGVNSAAEIDLEAICFDQGLVSVEGPIHKADAWMVRRGGIALARIRESLPYLGQKRFALAHELGHWIMHRTDQMTWYDNSLTLSDYRHDPREIEANAFASELLVPAHILAPMVPRLDICIASGLKLADAFGVGPFVALRKLLSGDGVNALFVVSDGAKVLYQIRSERCTLYSLPGGSPVPPGPTQTAVNEIGKVIRANVNARQWSDRAREGAPWVEEAYRPDADSPVMTLLRWGRG